MGSKLLFAVLVFGLEVSLTLCFKHCECSAPRFSDEMIECNLQDECDELVSYAAKHNPGPVALKIKEFFEKVGDFPKRVVSRIKYSVAKKVILNTLRNLGGVNSGDETPILDALEGFMDLFKPRIRRPQTVK